MSDAHGRPCIETTPTLDLERTLMMSDGNIFSRRVVLAVR